MKKGQKTQTLEESLTILKKEAGKDNLSLREILKILSGNGKSVLLILLSLPFCQPLQIPGLSTPFGIAIAFIGLRMALGKHALLPKKILAHEVKSSTLKKIIKRSLWLIQKINPFIHPRLNAICEYRIMKFMNALTIAFLGVFLALPLPIPFSNMLAALSIFLISIGTLKADGLFIILGYVLALLTLIIFIFLAFQSAAFFAHIVN